MERSRNNRLRESERFGEEGLLVCLLLTYVEHLAACLEEYYDSFLSRYFSDHTRRGRRRGRRSS